MITINEIIIVLLIDVFLVIPAVHFSGFVIGSQDPKAQCERIGGTYQPKDDFMKEQTCFVADMKVGNQQLGKVYSYIDGRWRHGAN